MIRRSLLIIVVSFLVVSPTLLQTFTGASVWSDDLIFIANKDVPKEGISEADVKNIFLGLIKEWSNSRRIVLAILKSGETHNHFLGNYIQKNPPQFINYWKKKVFTGEGSFPKTFQNMDDMMKFVADTPGAVGYVDKVTSDDVKILSIN